MKPIIGLYHTTGTLESLIGYVNSTFGTPKSLMLELPPDWREHQGGLRGNDNFFYPLAEEYERRGTKIIAGDINRYVVEPPPSEWEKEFERKYIQGGEWQRANFIEQARAYFGLLDEWVKYTMKVKLNLLSPAKGRRRNEGLLNAFNEENPELTVLGDFHARYLKSHRTDVNYIHFIIDSPFYRFIHWNDKALWRRVAYDSLQASPLPRKLANAH